MNQYTIFALGFIGGLLIGHFDERFRNHNEQRGRVVLSERIDSVSAVSEHDIYVMEDRLGRIEEKIYFLETSCSED